MERMRLASPADVGALTALWKTCFGDSEAYIEAFYRHRFDAIRIPVLTDGKGAVIGMVHLLPCTAHVKGEDVRIPSARKAFYLYAVGLAPEYRGSGTMRSFLTTIIDECTRRSIALLLSPANARLADYYRTYGFEFSHFYERGILDRAALGRACALDWQRCDGGHYHAARTACLSQSSYVEFAPDAVDYALCENAFFGGFALTSSEGDCAFGLAEGGRLLLREVCMTVGREERSATSSRLASLLDLFGATSCELRAPARFCDRMQTEFAVMAYGGACGGYMNLLLD